MYIACNYLPIILRHDTLQLSVLLDQSTFLGILLLQFVWATINIMISVLVQLFYVVPWTEKFGQKYSFERSLMIDDIPAAKAKIMYNIAKAKVMYIYSSLV